MGLLFMSFSFACSHPAGYTQRCCQLDSGQGTTLYSVTVRVPHPRGLVGSILGRCAPKPLPSFLLTSPWLLFF